MDKTNQLPHGITLKERREADISGVTEVISFDDLQAEVETACGRLVLQGQGLILGELNRATGELRITGKLDRFGYVERKKKGGLREALRK